MIHRLSLLILLISFPSFVAAEPIYKYKDKKGVVSLTDNLESIPKELRSSTEIIEKKTLTVNPAEQSRSLRDQAIIHGLFTIIVILSLLCFKLWIKNIIFKFIARVLIVVAFVGLLYLIVHYLFLSPDKNPFSLPQAVQEKIEPYRATIKKARKGIRLFQESQGKKQKDLEAVDSKP